MASDTSLESNPNRVNQALRSWGITAVITGSLSMLVGTYWDEAWHTDLGRDTLWSPPHLVLYGGVALVGLAVTLWMFSSYRQLKDLRATLRQGPLVLGLIGLIATLAAAPIDDFWHEAFGRDSVLFSPPHTTGLFGILALVGSVLLEITRLPERKRRWLTPFGGAVLLATLLVLVFEYDADVPQFSVFWYLPLLTGASALAFALCRNVARDGDWIATKAALVYTALMIGVFIFLTLLGFSKPIIPAIIIPALVFDWAARKDFSPLIQAGLFTISVFATYAPYLNYLTGGVRVGWVDALAGIPLAFLLNWLVLALTVPGRLHAPRQPSALLITLLSLHLFSLPALAHDPGQGVEVARMQLGASVTEGRANVAAELIDIEDCASFTPVRITARRAGQTLHALLEKAANCRFTGAITLPERGRWFVYVELTRQEDHQEDQVETWIPVIASRQPQTSERQASVYIPPPSSRSSLQFVAGVLLYAINLVLVGAVIVLFRRQASRLQA